VKTTLSERDGNTVKLAVEVSSDELREAFDTRLRQLSREVRLPGFRPGKAPAAMVRQRLGDEAILVDAVEEAMSGWFIAAMAELGLNPVDRPEIELEDDDLPSLDKPLSFKAAVTVMPDVVLGEYKGVRAPKDPAEVEDSEVDNQMDRLRNEFAELRPVGGRAVQKGDFITADLRATLDGQPVEDLEAGDFVFEIGGGRVFEEVEEQAAGMNADEEKTFPLTLPEALSSELAGKTVDFTIKVKEIKEKELPPLTDAWTSQVSEFATLLELRQEIRSKIREGKEHAAEQQFTAAAVKAATDNAEIDLPDVVVREQAEEMLADFRRSLESQGGTLESFVAASGVTEEQIIEDMKPQAANNVKTSLVLDAIAKAEGLEATDEEISAVIGQMAAVTRTDAKNLEARLRKGGQVEALREQILRDKAVEFIAKNAVAEAPAPAEEPEAPASKKTAPKKAKKATAAKEAAEDTEAPAAETAAPEAPEGAEAPAETADAAPAADADAPAAEAETVTEDS
jgi:trigger factor